MRTLSFIAALLISSVCSAAIVAPATAPSNSLVRVTTDNVGDGCIWQVSTATNLLVDFQQYEENDQLGICFTGPNAEYVILQWVYDAEKKSFSRAIAKTVIGGVIPNPNPNPNPNPQPNPNPNPQPTPGPTSPLADQMISWLSNISKTELTNEQIKEMANVYESVAAQAVATSETWPLATFKANTQQQIMQIISNEVAIKLADPFAKNLAMYLKAKGIAANDEAAHAAAWREVSAALTEVAGKR